MSATSNCKRISSRRGAIDPVTLAVLAIIAVVVAVKAPSSVPGRDHWWQFWKSNPVTQVDAAKAAADKLKLAEQQRLTSYNLSLEVEKRRQLAAAHEGSVATVSAIERAQDATSAGKLPVKELETAYSVAVVTRNGLDAATGEVVSPARVRELEMMVSQLNASNAAGTKALASMQGALDLSVSHEKELKTKNELDAAAAQKLIGAADEKFLGAVKSAETWALERDAIAKKFQNLKFYAFLIGGLILFLWIGSIVFPILGRFFPAFQAVSKSVGSLWAPGMQSVQNASSSLNTDFVAMTEWLKKELAKRATPEEMAKIKKTMSDDWMKVSDGTAQAVEQIKSKLRI